MAASAMKCLPVVDVADRPLAHFPPDIWGYHFLNFTSQDYLEMERYRKQIEPLKEEVKKMVMEKCRSPRKKMSTIDAVERLGVSHYYENEINEQLHKVFHEQLLGYDDVNHETNLYNTALQFRIFRQHGYHMPSDVFRKYTDENGKFKEALKNDIKSMVCLYEAAHLMIHGERILDEALHFTTNFLESIKKTSYDPLVHHALNHPIHLGIPRIETRFFISLYEKDDSRNETLLKLAKFEFNRLQLLHRQELSQILKWWKDLDFVTKLPYARNQWVESHFVSMAIFFEPQYSLARMLLAKVILITSIVDDSYDAYGTFEELQLLTQAFERWELSVVNDEFPVDYMNIVFDFVVNTCDEFAKVMSNKGKPFAAQFVKHRLLDLIRSYYVEAKWLNAGYVPTFDEYMMNGRISGLAPLLISSALMGMEEIVEQNSFELIIQSPKAIRACEIICRLKEDIGSHQEEQSRPHVASSVECYMKEYKMNREEVVEVFNKMVANALKDINEDQLVATENDGLPQPLRKPVLNLTRMVLHLYGAGIDGYTHSSKLIRDDILTTYVHPIPL